MEMENADVTLSQERYTELLRAERKLTALETAGVNNWEWYYVALDALDEDD